MPSLVGYGAALPWLATQRIRALAEHMHMTAPLVAERQLDMPGSKRDNLAIGKDDVFPVNHIAHFAHRDDGVVTGLEHFTDQG